MPYETGERSQARSISFLANQNEVIPRSASRAKRLSCDRAGDTNMSKKQKRKRQGHYCWSCNGYLANEKFSGKGHSRHLCRNCQKLGKDELGYREALNNLGRCVGFDGIISRRRRKQFEPFLAHADPRIRKLAAVMQLDDQAARRPRSTDKDDDCESLDPNSSDDILYQSS